ncbi:MAG TPA: prefoldin subunit beta [Thermoplasmata archaeon]|nr:prefoldin subunit beta [Thermoplasmata archaeon]
MAGQMEMTPQLQNQIVQYQQVQQQLQAVVAQKVQLEAQQREVERSFDLLKEAEADAAVYRMIGGLLVKAKDKDTVMKEIEERKETIEIRVRALESQEKHLKERYQSLHEQLSKIMGGGVGGG